MFNETPGVAMTELNEWLGKALAQDYEMAWLPLSQQLREKADLNEDALFSWFTNVEHSSYSSVMAFFAAVDTADESFPAPLNSESVPINLRLINQLESTAGKVTQDGTSHNLNVLHEALEKRLDFLNSLSTY